MLANFEQRDTSGAERVWTGRYRNLHNLPHWHLENELICVERGTVTVSHNHREYTLTTGEAIFLASGEIHYINSDPDSITAITLFDVALTADLTNHISSAVPDFPAIIRFWTLFRQFRKNGL